jgi:TolB-like protein/Tfp pilus assembly protein PilF
MNALHRVRGLFVSAVAFSLAACGGGGGLRLSDVTPASIPQLELERGERPGNAQTLARLGVAYFKAERYADARAPLDTAVQLDPSNGIAAVYLGMTTEQLGDFTAARTAYERYIAVSRSRRLRDAAEQRLRLVGRREMEFQARQALAAESTATGAAAPDANTIAVMPFTYTGTNTEIQPLTRGLAQLLVTDLAKSRQLRVLERERMQAMIDEMRLSAEGRADPASAVRSGRLLRAERVVQGSITDIDGRLRVDAAVVDVTTAGVAASPSATDELNRLFDLEKALAFAIFERLGITLSDAERAAINQRPTANMQAFLAFSRGLEAEDRGDYDAARDAFSEAVRIDPSFTQASQSAANAADLSVAAATPVAQVEAVVTQNAAAEAPGAPEQQQTALSNATEGTNGSTTTQIATETSTTPSSNPNNRDTTAEVTRTELPRSTPGTIVITIRRPQ